MSNDMESKMQSQMEGAEAHFEYLCELLNPPGDWHSPKWDEARRVHDWKNYPSDHMKQIWDTFTGEQKLTISGQFEELANAEEYT